MGFFNSEKHSLPTSPPPPPPPPPAYQHPHPTSSFASSSTQPLAPTFAALHLARSDRIRLVGFPQGVQGYVREAVHRAWPREIQQEGQYDAVSYEFKLRGNPWSGFGDEAVHSRRLMAHLLAALASSGWHLAASVDLSKKGYDKDTLLFRSGPAVQRQFFSVSFNQADKVRIIDWPSEVVKNAFDQAVRAAWPPGIQEAKQKSVGGAYQLKLRGNPWWSSMGSEINQARLMVCSILSALDACGYELAGSVDMSVGGGDNGSADLDTWFFASKM
ncbi:hypothetical protein JCM10207_005873 [Rhodosporidiobolus poonsookiae]